MQSPFCNLLHSRRLESTEADMKSKEFQFNTIIFQEGEKAGGKMQSGCGSGGGTLISGINSLVAAAQDFFRGRIGNIGW